MVFSSYLPGAVKLPWTGETQRGKLDSAGTKGSDYQR